MDQAARRRTGSAFRPGTRANQGSHATLYVAFSLFLQEQDFPASPRHLLRFAEFLLGSLRSHKSVTNALSSLRTFHLQHGFSVEAFSDYRLFLWKRALPATVRHVPSPARAMTREILDRLCSLARSLGHRGEVFSALLALAFASMARLSSLVPESSGEFDASRLPTLQDLRVSEAGVWLRLKWGKCHQDAGEGYWVPMLAVDGAPSCPALNARVLRAQPAEGSTDRGLFTFRGGRRRGGGVAPGFTMRLARGYLRALLESLGFGAADFTFHSLRRGACTLAFQGGAALSDLRQLGGWRSNAVEAYFPAWQARERAAKRLASGPSASFGAELQLPC